MGGAPMVDAAVGQTLGVIAAVKSATLPMIACVHGYHSRAAAPHWKAAPVLDPIEGTLALASWRNQGGAEP